MAATTKLLLSVCGFVCIWSAGCATASQFLGSGQALGYEEEEERLMGWQGESFDPVRVFGPREPHNAKEKSWVEVVSWKPRAFVYHHFLSDEECNHIIRLAAPQMKRSEVEPDDDEEGDGESDKSVITNHRTSYGMFIRRMFDPVVERLEERLANWTHLPVINQEDIQVLRYTHGQKYAAHYDSLGRVATVLVYLTDTEEGGETAFPQESEWVDPTLADSFGPFSDCAAGHVGVRPKKGTALLFFSLLPDGKTEDPASLHTGCPVLQGVKWTATVWIHAEPFRPGSLEQELEHPPEPVADPGLCEDYYERCLEWAQQGECENNPDFMAEFCRQSCGLCEPCANSDRDCYMKNREAAGYLTLDDEVEKLTGFRIGPYHAHSQAHHRRQHHHHHHHHH